MTRDRWILVGLAVVLTLAASAGLHSWRTGALVTALEAEKVTSDRLGSEMGALTFRLGDRDARLVIADGVLQGVRDSVRLARVATRAERSRASGAILELRGHVAAVAGDSAAVVALVDSIEVEHGKEVAALERDVAGLERTVAAFEVRISAVDAVVVTLRARAVVTDTLIASLEGQRDDWRRAYEREANPPLSLKLFTGAKWVAPTLAVVALVAVR